MVRRRTFKAQVLQQTYDWLMANRPDPEAWKVRGSAGNAYAVGRKHPDPKRPFANRGSIAYAAWVAGLDIAREEASQPTPQDS